MEGIRPMTRAFIWDLDGTLLDSYEAILDGIAETYAHYSIDFDREAVYAFILNQSVQALLEEVARRDESLSRFESA
jgi:beta-phosphoglucomutase-like phosphatase (HAD superfamily)